MKKMLQFFDLQRALFFLLAGMFAFLPSILFWDLLRRAGYTDGLWALSILFVILSWNIAWGTTHSLIGFCARLGPGTRKSSLILSASECTGSVAIVLPVYNEDPTRVFAGLRAMYESVQKTGHGDRFDFFILSDSTKSERWIEEEYAWARLCRDLNAFGRINYRRRAVNTDKKAGNLLEFCEAWGQRYRYMITLDADSVMTGETIVELYRRMESNGRIGILQTAPQIVFAESFWGRLQQFANHFYGPVFAAGLHFWQRREGNYWGHNAIIRMAPFMEHCALPDLPGREPFGGKILSHDFVEAALMQRAGFEVALAKDLTGSYEECPQDIVEHAKRDRRWCQGNMQHIWLLFSRGLNFASRIHLANGIMGYASSLLWAAFMLLGGIFLFNRVRSRLSTLPMPGLKDWYDMPLATHSAIVASITLSFLFLPKFLALADALLTRGRAKQFGGFYKCCLSVAIESLCSALTAPILMLYHAKFVIFTAIGKGVGWTSQNRDAGDGLSLADAIRAHGGQAIIGALAMLAASQVNASFFLWLLPVGGALVVAPWTSWALSKPSWGEWLRRRQLLVDKETLDPVDTLRQVEALSRDSEPDAFLPRFADERDGCMNAIVDPYLNAVRTTMAISKVTLGDMGQSEVLGHRALAEGPDALTAAERRTLVCDPVALVETHHLAWMRDPKTLHPAWMPYFTRYTPSLPALPQGE